MWGAWRPLVATGAAAKGLGLGLVGVGKAPVVTFLFPVAVILGTVQYHGHEVHGLAHLPLGAAALISGMGISLGQTVLSAVLLPTAPFITTAQ